MYAVYKQAHPPTGLEFSMYCNFFSNAERNLVVAGTSQLYVYRLNHDSEVRWTTCLGVMYVGGIQEEGNHGLSLLWWVCIS